MIYKLFMLGITTITIVTVGYYMYSELPENLEEMREAFIDSCHDLGGKYVIGLCHQCWVWNCSIPTCGEFCELPNGTEIGFDYDS